MTDIIELDSNYSTTRRVIKTDSQYMAEVLKQSRKPEDKFKSVLFLPKGEGRQGEGGLRTQGYFKQMQVDKPLITVVTVVFNGEQFLEGTILSVINQTYDNVEYIIIDGGSTDGTLDIIRKYEHAIDYWVSENDKGLYDAMNKGIDLAIGEWINFMNGGDEFYALSVLSDIFTNRTHQDAQILYGNHQVIYPSGRIRLVKAGLVKSLWKGAQFCHQASFVKADYHKVHKFNLCTKMVADFEFFYKAWKANAQFKFIDVIAARFKASGVSDINRIDSILGRWCLIDKFFSFNLYYLYLVAKELFKMKLKRLVPARIFGSSSEN